MAIIHDGNSVPISSGNPLPTQLSGSDVQIPVDIQGRYATTTQTHVGTLIAPASANVGAYIDCIGFQEIAITFKNDAATQAYADIWWSHDGSTYHSADAAVITGTTAMKTAVVSVKARYFRLALGNSDVAPHTMNAWAYLKA